MLSATLRWICCISCRISAKAASIGQFSCTSCRISLKCYGLRSMGPLPLRSSNDCIRISAYIWPMCLLFSDCVRFFEFIATYGVAADCIRFFAYIRSTGPRGCALYSVFRIHSSSLHHFLNKYTRPVPPEHSSERTGLFKLPCQQPLGEATTLTFYRQTPADSCLASAGGLFFARPSRSACTPRCRVPVRIPMMLKMLDGFASAVMPPSGSGTRMMPSW